MAINTIEKKGDRYKENSFNHHHKADIYLYIIYQSGERKAYFRDLNKVIINSRNLVFKNKMKNE